MNTGTRFLPFADAATPELPLGRLLRLSLFQVTVGMATVLLMGTLNRVMIVELNMPASIVAVMVALPVLFAPFRALIGHKSDTHRSYLGWRRLPYIWLGSLLQFGGLSVMPLALMVLGRSIEDGALFLCAVTFLLTGAGLHTTQTAGLALANDLAPPEARPRVVALLYVMLLLGMVVSALAYSFALQDFSNVLLIRVLQASAVLTVVINVIAVWKQEVRNKVLTDPTRERPTFRESWKAFATGGQYTRLLIVVGLGTLGFTMQDILLEPYGAQILGLSVSATTLLSALWAGGTLAGFALAARWLSRGMGPYRLAAIGSIVGVFAFACVIFAAPLESATVFRVGAAFIGLGGGLFVLGTLTAAMDSADSEHGGLALGAWGAVQATATGVAVALGGAIRDGVSALTGQGVFGEVLQSQGISVGYGFVYVIEIGLLIVTLVVIGPLVRSKRDIGSQPGRRLGLSDIPG
jgi:BCD family chlorophyll transporter-like MFS transporter